MLTVGGNCQDMRVWFAGDGAQRIIDQLGIAAADPIGHKLVGDANGRRCAFDAVKVQRSEPCVDGFLRALVGYVDGVRSGMSCCVPGEAGSFAAKCCSPADGNCC